MSQCKVCKKGPVVRDKDGAVCVSCGQVDAAQDFVDQLQSQEESVAYGEEQQWTYTEVQLKLGGQLPIKPANESDEALHVWRTVQKEDAVAPRVSAVMRRTAGVIRAMGKVKWPILVERETQLVRRVRWLMERILKHMSKPKTHPRRRKHMLYLPKDNSITVGALLFLAVENDSVMRGLLRVGHLSPYLLENSSSATTEELHNLENRICRLIKSITRNGLNADPSGAKPTTSAHFQASVQVFSAKHFLPAAYSQKACLLLDKCVNEVWLGGRYPSNAEGAVLLYLLQLIYTDTNTEWDLPIKMKRRLRLELEQDKLPDIVCNFLMLQKRTVIHCAQIVAERVQTAASSSSSSRSNTPSASSNSQSTSLSAS